MTAAVESLERRTLLTQLVGIVPNDGSALLDGDIRREAPTELTFQFALNDLIDPNLLGGIQIVRSGLDDLFGDPDDVSIAPGFLGIGDRPNEVIFRFAETLPDDRYQITVSAALNNGTDLVRTFDLDLGAQIVAVTPQPVLREQVITVLDAALVADGDAISVSLAGTQVVFELEDLNVSDGVSNPLHTPVEFTSGVDDEAAIAAAIAAAIDSSGLNLSAAAAGPAVTITGDSFTPVLSTSVLEAGGITTTVGGLVQRDAQIVVHFNRDELDQASAENPAFYQLIDTKGTLDHIDDTIQLPISVAYDAAASAAVLTFGIAGVPAPLLAGTYRLRVGVSDLPSAVTVNVGAGSDNNSSFATATTLNAGQNLALGAGGQIVISAQIQPQSIALPPLPGGLDEPGHRHIPVEAHFGSSGTNPVVPGTIGVIRYNFQDIIGSDPQGNTLFNLITEEQKNRARDIFELYANALGLEAIETASSGITVATGDMRAVDPLLPVGPGGVGGVSAGSLVVMDPADTDDGEYNGSWFIVALHEIGHSLGLGHSTDVNSVNAGSAFDLSRAEAVWTGDHDLVHLNRIFRPDSTDIDLYRFDLAEDGRLMAEVFAERLAAPSLLNSALTLFDGDGNILARNDDYFSNDAFLELDLPAGTYFIGVTSTGNLNYDPNVSDTGSGGTTDGNYQLRMNFLAAPGAGERLTDATGTAFDGDADGVPGGAFDFWFRAGETVFVDKANAGAAGQDGSLANPFSEIDDALNAVSGSTAIIRILGNGGADGDLSTPDDARPYLIGFDDNFNFLEDSDESPNGSQNLEVPQGVTLVIDEGAVLKLQNAIIDVGSSSDLVDRSQTALQVLGTPANRVVLTSHGNDAIGGDTDGLTDGANPGDWGGIVFRADSDLEDSAVFLNHVGQAHISFGGGQVFVDSVREIFNPIHVSGARPTISFNVITASADAAISADPNSFDESIRDSATPSLFNRDATLRRVGPDIHGNTLVANTVNGLFVRVETEFGKAIDVVSVSARFDDTDIVHVITENIQIVGSPGGPIEVGGVRLARESGRLRIDPGTVVKLSGSRIEAERGHSNFIAEGTAARPIVFTSIFDDRFGRGGTFDTTNDDNSTIEPLPQPGDWGGIVLNAVSNASIDHAFIAFGGGLVPIEGDFDRFNVIESIQGDLRLTNTRLEDNASGASSTNRNGRGANAAATVFVRGEQPVIAGNLFLDNAGPVISINVNSLRSDFLRDPGRSTGPLEISGGPATAERLFDPTTGRTQFPDNRGPLVTRNVLENNTLNGMEVRAEELTIESVWDDTDIVHIVRGEMIVTNFHTLGGLRLESSPDASLVVKLDGPNAGFTASGFGLDIDDRIGGIVQILGLPGRPVVLTALADDTAGAGVRRDGLPQRDTNNDGSASAPQPGGWRSIRLEEFSYDRNVEIINEEEGPLLRGTDSNAIPPRAQFLGELAPNGESGDENQRLGFEVHGFIAADSPGDRDLYSFTADAGTQVWIDLDRTDPTLNGVVELLDPLGRVLARASTPTPNNNVVQSFSVGGQPAAIVGDLTADPLGGGDFYTSNPHDPGFRIVLPGVEGQLNTYFLRVRSFSSDLNNATGGQTSGQYQLQLRLDQKDEEPGSTIRGADIRFATTGIEVFGMPGHSPLVGEAGEAPGDNNTLAQAQQLGNLLTTDRNTISVSGQVSSPADVDFYQFTLDYDLIQAIGGVNAGGKTWSTVFDIDWADGLSRPDTTLSVFDATGRLILVSRDSDIADDQPRPSLGVDFGDEERGSAGKLDPFIGAAQLPAGIVPAGSSFTYFVAVSHGSRLPAALEATFNGGSTNSTVRLEPVNSVVRIAEDHIGFNGYTSGDPGLGTLPVDPVVPSLLDISNAQALSAHVTPFTLGDVQLFVHSGTTLVSINPLTGGINYTVNGVGGVNNAGYGDIAMRWDGVLFGQTRGNNNANSGNFRALDVGSNTQINLGDDGLGTNPDQGGQWEALAFRFNTGTNTFETFAVNNETADDDNNPATAPPAPNPGFPAALHELNSDTGAAIDQSTAAGFQAVRNLSTFVGLTGNITGMAFTSLTGGTLLGVDSNGNLWNMFAGTLIRNNVVPNPIGFTGLTNGPQNLRVDLNGDGTLDSLANTFFATGTDNRLYALDAAGNLVNIWDTNGDNVADSSSLSIGLGDTRGVAFSTLDFNLWHPTMLRRGDAGHGINAAIDNSRNPGATEITINGRDSNEGEGGASFYFGMETFATDSTNAYFDTYGVADAQFGVQSGVYQQAATNASRVAAITASSIGGPIQNNYNLPGGAQGSLTTSSFSLEGYARTDRPTVYFNYFLDSQGVNSTTNMLDSARVFVSTNGGASFQLLATNNSVTDHELPDFPSVSSIYAAHPQQRVQEIFDDAGDTDGWRQARVDLGDFAGQPNVLLRFDFTTAGTFVAPTGGADPRLPGIANSGNLATNNTQRALNNAFEGFYIDDIIVGFAERGEMVTGAPADASTFFQTPDNPDTEEVTAGTYQLEIRRGTEYGFLLTEADPEIVVVPLGDSNVRLARGATFTAPAGSGILDGDFFALSDGVHTIEFEFDNNSSVGTFLLRGQTVGRVPIPFNAGQSAAAVANSIAAAVNSVNAAFPQLVPDFEGNASSIGSSDLVQLVGIVSANSTFVPLNLSVGVSVASLSEAGAQRTSVTVTREGPTGAALAVNLSDIDPATGGNSDEVVIVAAGTNTPISTLVIPAGFTSATFDLVTIDDAIVDGTQAAVIRATAAGFTSVAGLLDITDNETPALTVTITGPTSILESGGTSTATVTRNTPTGSSLIVSLASLDLTEASVPGTVLILAGATSASFTIAALDDILLDGDQTFEIVAFAPGFASGSDTITVLDDLTDFAIQSTLNVGLNFTGSNVNQSGFIPPDTMGGVGPNHIVELINGRFAVYNKANGSLITASSLDQFWTNAGATFTGFTFDPRILFDPTEDRWIATAINGGAANSIFIAVSETNDPTGTWRSVQFIGDTVDGARFNDFDTLGLDADGVYISTNNFGGPAGFDVSVYSIPKADLFAPTPFITRLTRFENLNSATFGSSIQPAVDFGPSDGRAVFLAARAGGAADLVRFSVLNAAGPGPAVLTTPMTIPVPAYGQATLARQPGSNDNIEIVSPRFAGYVQEVGDSLWAAHAVVDPATPANAYIQWYEIDETATAGGAAALLQTDTISNPLFDFYNVSIAANAFGDVVIGFSGSGDEVSGDQFISAMTAVGSTVGGVTTFGAPFVNRLGVDNYFEDFGSGRNRWGDYSATVVDPTNPFVFWTFQEFAFQQDDWANQITELQVPNDRPELTVSVTLGALTEAGPGNLSAATVTRTGDLSAPLVVNLTTSDASEAIIVNGAGNPISTLLIPASSSTATFFVRSVNDAVADGTQTVFVSAAASGFSGVSDFLDVLDDERAALSVIVAPGALSESAGPGAAIGTVTRNTELLSLPLTVFLTSSDTSEITVPAFVVIPAFQTSATFPINTVNELGSDGTRNAVVFATAPGFDSGNDDILVTADAFSTAQFASFNGLGDSNLDRQQGQLLIQGNTIADAASVGILLAPGPREAGSNISHPGAPLNLPTLNSQRLARSAVIQNNVIVGFGQTGISISGDANTGNVAPAAVPFARIVNNTIVGSTAAGGSATADIIFLIDNSASMGAVIDAIKQRLLILDTAAASVNPRYGAVRFPVTASGSDPVQIQDLVDFATFSAVGGPFDSIPIEGAVENGSQAILEALNGFDPQSGPTTFSLRPGARPVLIMVTNEDDDSPADQAAALAAIQALNGLFFGVVSPNSGTTLQDYGQFATATGGTLFDVNQFLQDPDTLFDSFVQALVGSLTVAGDGIVIENNASPTLLNNIVANTLTAISIDASSSSTVVGTTLFRGNADDLSRPANATGSNAIFLTGAEPLFVDAPNRNFYLADNSRAIDSSLNRLADRPAIVGVGTPLEIPPSDIFAPLGDALGQLRVDDPSQSPPPGLGPNIFKDRGAIERADFVGPTARLVTPQDNVTPDVEPAATEVFLVSPGDLTEFVIKLEDLGIGIDDSSVASSQFELRADGLLLTDGTEYEFRYNPDTDTVRLLSTQGPFPFARYTIDINNGIDGIPGPAVRDIAGNPVQKNQTNPGTETRFTILLGPEFTIDDVTIDPEGDAGDTAIATFTITLSHATTNVVTVDVFTSDGTATAGLDYLPVPLTTLTFNPGGPLTQTVSVTVNGDEEDEFDEDFFVNLANVTNARIADPQGLGTIVEDDDNPRLSIDDVQVVEGASGDTVDTVFTISLSHPTNEVITVDVSTADGSATDGSDYAGLPLTTLTFNPGEPTTQTVTVVVNGDGIDEFDETFFVDLTNVSPTAVIADGQGVGTILNDDNPSISISDAAPVLEGDSGTTGAVFTVSLSHPTNEVITVDVVTADGTATLADADYVGLVTTLTFDLGGPLSQTVTVFVNGDGVDEFSETFFVNLTNVSASATLADGQGRGTILNDDNPSISINDVQIVEGDAGPTNAVFTVSLSNPTNEVVTVQVFTSGGTATAGGDYVPLPPTTLVFQPGGATSQPVTIVVNGDLTDEFDETFFVNLGNVSSTATIADGQGVGTILNDDNPEISINDLQILEGNAGTKNLVFTVSLSNPTNEVVSVTVFTSDGTGTLADNDYVPRTATLTFNPGAPLSQGFAVTINGDRNDEFDETFFVNLTSSPTGTVVKAQGVGTILNDDNPSISINDIQVVEGDTGTTAAVFTLSLSNPTNEGITVDVFTSDGTGTLAGNDYASLTTTVTFNPGQPSTQTVTVAVTGDGVDEFNETFFLNLTNVSATATIADNQGRATILNDDNPEISIADAAPVLEGDSGTTNALFTVSLSNPTNEVVTVQVFTSDGTATAGSDYVALPLTTLTFSPGGPLSQIVPVAVIGDTEEESDETFFVNLTNVSATATIADAQALGTILEDIDGPIVSADDVQVVEGNSGTRQLVFTVSLSSAPSQVVTVDVFTSNGTATAGSDYVAVLPTTLIFNSGAPLSQTVSVTVHGDLAQEDDEDFFLNLDNVTNAIIIDPQGRGTIVDDDSPLITINDVTVAEPAPGAVNTAVFTVTLSKPGTREIRVDFATLAGTATDTGRPDEQTPSDYDRVFGTLVFSLGGPLTRQISVPINGDAIEEGDEDFFMLLSNAVAAKIADATGTALITDATSSPLRAGAGQGAAGAPVLTDADVATVLNQAVARWAATGLSQTQVDALHAVTFEIRELNDDRLAQTTGSNVRLDVDAAGWGWFVDATPADDREFTDYVGGTEFSAAAGSVAAGQVDLLTVVMHELGHVLGNEHTDVPRLLMTDTLPTGARRFLAEPVAFPAGSLSISAQQLRHDAILVLSLPEQNAGGATLSYAAALVTSDPLAERAWQLDQTHRLTYSGDYSLNWGGAGEKWMMGDGGSRYYFITPDGTLYRWTGARAGATFLSGSTRLATLDGSYHANPNRLHNALQPQSGGGDVGGSIAVVNGNHLAIRPGDGYQGDLLVQVTATGGSQNVSTSFTVSVVNRAPELELPDQTVSHNVDVVTIDLPRVDQDGDALSYSVELQAGDPLAELAYELDQTHRLTFAGNGSTNWGGAGEKWMSGDGGTRYYIITPDGTLYRWTGARPGATFLSGSTRLATLDGSYHADPSRLHNAPKPQGGGDVGGSTAALVNGNQIAITPGEGYHGDLVVQVTASDGVQETSTSFTVSVANLAPELNLADRTVSHTVGTVNIDLPAVDGDGDSISYTVELQAGDPLAELAWQLDQTHRLTYSGGYSTNWGGAGEKWLLGDGGTRWYFITPNGTLYRWTGARPGATFLSGSTRLATLDGSYHADPNRLHNALQPQAGGDVGGSTVTLVNGNRMAIRPGAGFQGDLVVQVTATDGLQEVSTSFTVSVTNLAPELNLADRTVAHTVDTVSIDLPAVDGDGEAVTYTVTVETGDPLAELARQLDQTHRLTFNGNYTTNWGGAGEKWMLGDGGTRYYFITPDGTLYRWTGARPGATFLSGSTRLATLAPAFHANPSRLHDAPPAAGGNLLGSTATIQNGHELVIDPGATFRGDLRVTVTASDGRNSVARSFELTVVEGVPQEGHQGVLAQAFSGQALFDELDGI